MSAFSSIHPSFPVMKKNSAELNNAHVLGESVSRVQRLFNAGIFMLKIAVFGASKTGLKGSLKEVSNIV